MHKLFIILCFVFVAACDVKITDTQRIEIKLYENKEDNQKLAEDLMYYDPGYISMFVPSLTNEVRKGISLGHFIRASDGQASYQITYRLDNKAVTKNHEQLKKQFSEFIPQLAEVHVQKAPVFKSLETKGHDLAKSMFTATSEDFYAGFSNVIRDKIAFDEFKKFHDDIKGKGLVTLEYLRSQYYDAYADFPASYAMFYRLETNTGQTPVFKVNYTENQGGWDITGFGLYYNAT